MAADQRWALRTEGHEHEIEIADAGLGRQVVWRRDGEVIVSRRTSDERVRLVPHDAGPGDLADAGTVGLRFGWFGPARRVTWYAAGDGGEAAASLVGVGGVDFEPQPGSKAARREEWIRAHPRLYTARRGAAAIGSVLGGVLAAWLLARFAFSIRLPGLPRIPLPDLPDLPGVPWPSIPWPDVSLPDWSLPGWAREVASYAKFVFPVVLALGMARSEIRRKRQQEARRLRERPGGPAHASGEERADRRLQ